MAQLASASGLGPEGPVFESQYPDEIQKQLSDFQVVAFSFLCIFLCKNKFSITLRHINPIWYREFAMLSIDTVGSFNFAQTLYG